MHPVILMLFSLLITGSAIKFDKVKLKATLDKSDKDPEEIPCWNSTRWGHNPINVVKILDFHEIIECSSCPCKLVKTRDSNLNICEKCDLDKTRTLANNYAESKFTADQIAKCGTSSKCADYGYGVYPDGCTKCPEMFSVPTLKKFMGLLTWLEGLKA